MSPNYTKYLLLLLSDKQNSLFETLFKKAFCGRSEAFFVVSDFLLAVVVWRSLSVDVFYLLYERLGECPNT